MSSSNLSQVLLRNSDYLSANSVLLVNLPADGFIHEYQSLYPQITLAYFTTNFEQHLAVKQSSPTIDNQFGVTFESEARFDLIILAFPKTKAEFAFTLHALQKNMTEDARIMVVGENKGGVKSVPKLAKELIKFCNKIDSARHCSLFSGLRIPAEQAFEIDSWIKRYPLKVNNTSLTIAALPGVFSQSELDVGTRLLLENLPEKINGKTLDFGCGAGVIAAFIGKSQATQTNAPELHLADVSALALYSAEKTLTENGLSGTFIATNSLSHISEKYDCVVSNPPFHQGVKTNYQATETFLGDIKRHFTPKGSIYVVANSFLRYQPIMESAIGMTKTLAKAKGFTIYHCQT